MTSKRTSWRRAASRSRSPVVRPHIERARSRERRWLAEDRGDARYRPTDGSRGGYADAYCRPDDRDRSASTHTGHRAHSASARDSAQRHTADPGDCRRDARRAIEDSGQVELRHDTRRAYAPSRPSDSLSASHRHNDRRAEPRRDRQGVESRQQGDNCTGHGEARDNRTAHLNVPLSSARAETRLNDRATMGPNRGGRPSTMHIELNKRIVAARDAKSILAIVEAERGAFNAVNAATACNRLAKTCQGSSHNPMWRTRFGRWRRSGVHGAPSESPAGVQEARIARGRR